MVEPLTDTGEQLRQFLAVLSYYLPRTVSFMVFFPLLWKGLSSSLIKMSVGSVLVLYPAFASTTLYFSSMNPPAFTLITFLSEVVLGALLGLTIAFPYYAFKAFGALVDVYRGATFAAQATGIDSGEELPIEQLFGLLFAALIFAGPGLHAVSVHLLNSYLVMPPGTLTLLSLDSWLTTMLRMAADHITFSVLLSGPVLIAILAVELVVEIISAFTQQLQVYSLEFGLRSVFGIAALITLMFFAEQEILTMFWQYSESLNLLLGDIQ